MNDAYIERVLRCFHGSGRKSHVLRRGSLERKVDYFGGNFHGKKWRGAKRCGRAVEAYQTWYIRTLNFFVEKKINGIDASSLLRRT